MSSIEILYIAETHLQLSFALREVARLTAVEARFEQARAEMQLQIREARERADRAEERLAELEASSNVVFHEALPAILQRVNEKIVSVSTREKHRVPMSAVYEKGFSLGVELATSVVTSLAEDPSDFLSLSGSSRPTP